MPRDIIVVGASADGLKAIQELLRLLPGELRGALFIVLHTGPMGGRLLPDILQRSTKLPVAAAQDGEPIRRGRVYLAPPDCHLLVKRGQVGTSRGARENRFRPAIDPLFRSAARAYGSRVLAIILSGLLDDGAFGMREVVAAGGAGLVQDPFEATFPDMPQAALRRTPDARPLKLSEIAAEVVAQVRGAGDEPMRRDEARDASDEIEDGHRMSQGGGEGSPTMFTCPDCGGTLQELRDGELTRYRCHVGHGFTSKALMVGLDDGVEESLWQALRSLEEAIAFRRRLGERALMARLEAIAHAYEREASDLQERADALRRVLEEPVQRLPELIGEAGDVEG